jgi:hypothetical protein
VSDGINLQINLPENLSSCYADFANLWHTPDVFVIDFLQVDSPPVPVDGPDGQPAMVLPARVAQRVRIPPKQVFELMKALESQLSKWESENGLKPGESPHEGPTA